MDCATESRLGTIVICGVEVAVTDLKRGLNPLLGGLLLMVIGLAALMIPERMGSVLVEFLSAAIEVGLLVATS